MFLIELFRREGGVFGVIIDEKALGLCEQNLSVTVLRDFKFPQPRGIRLFIGHRFFQLGFSSFMKSNPNDMFYLRVISRNLSKIEIGFIQYSIIFS